MENIKNQTIDEYGEVDLRDVIRVMLKWKKLILGLALAAAILAAGVSYSMPAVYSVDAVIEAGSLINAGDEDSKVSFIIPIESPLQIKEKIDRGIYGVRSREKLGYSAMPKIIAVTANGTNVVDLSIRSADYDKAKTYLAAVCDEIMEVHKKKGEAVKSLSPAVAVNDTVVIKPAEVSGPVGPNVALNVAVAVILGLFLGIFLAFTIDWWKKS